MLQRATKKVVRGDLTLHAKLRQCQEPIHAFATIRTNGNIRPAATLEAARMARSVFLSIFVEGRVFDQLDQSITFRSCHLQNVKLIIPRLNFLII